MVVDDVVAKHHVGCRHRTRVGDRAALLVRFIDVGDRQIGKVQRCPALHIKRTISETTGADDSRARARSLDRNVTRDIEIACGRRIFPLTCERQGIGARTEHDRVGPCVGIGVDDGFTQRARTAIAGRRDRVGRERALPIVADLVENQRRGVDRAARVLEFPVAALLGVARDVVRRRNVGPRDLGQCVDQQLAALARREIAAIDEDVAIGTECFTPRCKCRRLRFEGTQINAFLTQTDAAVAGMADEVERVEVVVAGEQFADLSHPRPCWAQYDDIELRISGHTRLDVGQQAVVVRYIGCHYDEFVSNLRNAF